jgi:GDSL-like Lipase/Acylhydrolase family
MPAGAHAAWSTSDAPSRARSSVFRAVMLTLSAVLSVVLAEAVVRVVHPEPVGFSWMTAEGITVHVPNRTAVYRQYDVEAEVSINALGFRGGEFAIPKPPGMFRILAIGDSFTEAMQVAERDSYVARIHEALSRHRVEVLNLGVSGYGTSDELALLRAYGPRLEPDLAILFFAVQNDVRNNLQSPLCKRTADGVACSDPARLSRARLAMLQLRCQLASYSHLYQLVREAAASSFLARVGLRQAGPADAPPEMPFGPDLYRVQEPAYLGEGIAFTQEVFRQVADFNRSLGAETWLVVIPIREQIADADWADYSMGLSDVQRDRPQRALAALGHAVGAETIDLYPAFRARAETGEQLYFRIDAHLSPVGHEVAAAEVVSRLEALRPWERDAR